MKNTHTHTHTQTHIYGISYVHIVIRLVLLQCAAWDFTLINQNIPERRNLRLRRKPIHQVYLPSVPTYFGFNLRCFLSVVMLLPTRYILTRWIVKIGEKITLDPFFFREILQFGLSLSTQPTSRPSCLTKFRRVPQNSLTFLGLHSRFWGQNRSNSDNYSGSRKRDCGTKNLRKRFVFSNAAWVRG